MVRSRFWLKKIFLLLIILVAQFFFEAAQAEYYLPPAQERFMLLARQWQIKDGFLTLDFQGKKRQWKIEPFWLADRVDSDSICTGSYRQKMAAYLEKLEKLPEGAPLLVELVAAKKGEALFAAGLWQYDEKKSYENARKYGSAILELNPAQIDQLGSAAQYEKKLRETFQENWKLVGEHK